MRLRSIIPDPQSCPAAPGGAAQHGREPDGIEDAGSGSNGWWILPVMVAGGAFWTVLVF